ncbi:hypothetical protein H2201_001277 [Coniosporium apollinis]|uniref:ER-bound oxygenase mpaB/mpaB'/Rubber oxygenase catalytic domain-containing protein n=2 Tax=Coniosporium TaxID=2810619 RepID=A0ABQ9P4V6_9PEZI|nr:hypothetical protein H2199_001686 [Cladosporium sp. JES 115]KAJ9668635.1 hypothetical protein H2201_001277 [Coniosporium apollinis]
MTNEHAWEIQKYVFSLEFPFTVEKSLQFALFRQVRVVDTAVLISEFIGHSPTTSRHNAAIARMNYLHSIYQKSGLISNDDMLFTLALFALEPIRWIRRYEWRDLTPMETCAIATFWKSTGDAMEISYDVLPSSGTGWRDGLHWLEEVEAWSQAYEERCMVPDVHNHQTANETTAILLYEIPKPLWGIGKKIVSAMMDDRLRAAMLYEPPPSGYIERVNYVFLVRRLILRSLALPRPYALRYMSVTDDPDPKTGRYYRTVYDAEPWYVPATFWNRFGPQAWMRWLAGRPYPGRGFKPEGFTIPEVGPVNMEGKGRDYFEDTKGKLMGMGRGGCPFAFQRG